MAVLVVVLLLGLERGVAMIGSLSTYSFYSPCTIIDNVKEDVLFAKKVEIAPVRFNC